MSAPTTPLRQELDRLLEAVPATAALDERTRERLVAFVELLVKWNRVWNLSAVRDPVEMLERHVLDSLTLLPLLDEALDGALDLASVPPVGPTSDDGPDRARDADLLDIGSGAGLPVLPLAIARPAIRCASVERTGKKARFQRQVLLELGLERVEVLERRIEDVTLRAAVVTSRAFTAPESFLRLAERHLAPEGRVLLMLGRAERLPEALPEPFVLDELVRLPGEVERHVAVCRWVCAARS